MLMFSLETFVSEKAEQSFLFLKWKHLKKDVTIKVLKSYALTKFFRVDSSVVYCCDNYGLLNKLK